MKRFFVLFLVMLLPAAAIAGERPDRPHWSLELKGGVRFPDVPRWSDFYGSSYFGEYGGALSYKLVRQLELGVEATYSGTTGQGEISTGQKTGEVSYRQVPLDLFVLARGVFDERQLLVPYLGGGYTRLFYREEVKGQGKTEGSVNGFHVRGGLQFLLDRLEPQSAEELYRDFGLHHTYFILEGKYTRALADTLPSGSVNLGGESCLAGFLFEF